jgi:hypothetical protein
MQKWEYFVLNLGWNQEKKLFYWFDPEIEVLDGIAGKITDDTGVIERLQELGEKGFELINVVTLTHAGTVQVVRHYFKRLIEE